MLFYINILIAGIVTFCALVGLLPCMDEGMILQSNTPVERFVALLTKIFFYSSMGSLVTDKARPVWPFSINTSSLSRLLAIAD